MKLPKLRVPMGQDKKKKRKKDLLPSSLKGT